MVGLICFFMGCCSFELVPESPNYILGGPPFYLETQKKVKTFFLRIFVRLTDCENVRVRVRDMTGSVALDGIGHPEHHRTANINDGILHTKVETRLTAKRQRITAILDGALYPHHAPGSSIGFQRRKGCSVRAKEVTRDRVIPKNSLLRASAPF